MNSIPFKTNKLKEILQQKEATPGSFASNCSSPLVFCWLSGNNLLEQREVFGLWEQMDLFDTASVASICLSPLEKGGKTNNQISSSEIDSP